MAWRYDFYLLMLKTIFYSLTALVRKRLFSPLEDKSHIFVPLCNILYIFSAEITLLLKLVASVIRLGITKVWKFCYFNTDYINHHADDYNHMHIYFKYKLTIFANGNAAIVHHIWVKLNIHCTLNILCTFTVYFASEDS